MASSCTTGVPHEFDPDSFFCCKLRYWREQRGLATSTGSINGVLQGPDGKVAFHGDHADGGTIRERRDTMIAQARAKGIDPVPV